MSAEAVWEHLALRGQVGDGSVADPCERHQHGVLGTDDTDVHGPNDHLQERDGAVGGSVGRFVLGDDDVGSDGISTAACRNKAFEARCRLSRTMLAAMLRRLRSGGYSAKRSPAAATIVAATSSATGLHCTNECTRAGCPSPPSGHVPDQPAPTSAPKRVGGGDSNLLHREPTLPT